MRKFRSHTIIHYLTSKAFVLWVPICMLGVFQLAFSHFAFAVDSNPGTPSSEINVDLVNGIAVRILDEAGQQQIDNINLDLTAVPGGSFVSGKFNVEVSTSNKTGYKLYMDSSYDQSSVMGTTSPDYTTNLVNQVNTSYIIPTLTNNVSLSEFQSGSNNSSNKWGYSLDDTTFSPIPVHATPDMVDSSSTPTASTLTPVTIGTNVNMDMASGVYKNQLTFSAVAEPVPVEFTLHFDSNGGAGTVADLTATQVSSSYTFTLPDDVYIKDGYEFTGWATSPTGTGTYWPGDSFTVTTSSDPWETEATLYATFDKTLPTFWTISTMQEMTSTICSSVFTPSNVTGDDAIIIDKDAAMRGEYKATAAGSAYVAQGTLRDIRDNNTYTVAKLADGNCWMTQNLRLVGPRTLTSSDTNIPSGASFNLLAPISASSWCTSFTSSCIDKSETVLFSGYEDYGALYNWFTATSGTGTSSVTYATSYSICPKQWKLPNTGSSNNFDQLYQSYGSGGKNLLGLPISMMMAGSVEDGATKYRNSIGVYWQNAGKSNASYANDMYIDSSGVYASSRDSAKYSAESVRCLLQ